MPQFEFATWPGQIVWALIIFGVLFVVMRSVFLPRIQGTLETRSGQIEGSMAEARRLRDEAEAQAEVARAETAEARGRAQRTAAEAKARAAAEAAQRNAALEAELGAKLSAAETRIRAARDQAMGQVGGIAADTAAALTEKLTGRAATGEELARAAEHPAQA
jgi:F-type H+-transporting ATPase subunit b